MELEQAAEVQRLRADAEYMRFLVRAGEILSSSLDYRETLQNVCQAAVATIGDICLLFLGEEDTQLVAVAHSDPAQQRELAAAGSYLDSEPGRPNHPICEVLHTGRSLFVPKLDEAWILRNATGRAHAEFMRRMRFRSMIIVPIISQTTPTRGAICLIRTDRTRRAFDADALLLAQDLGRRCGAAIGKAALHSQAVETATAFQRSALPARLPALPELRFDAFYEPGDAEMMVGGDWYDAFPLRDGRIGLSIGDVAGHGLESAITMSRVRNALRTALLILGDGPKALETTDDILKLEGSDLVCTALVGIWDPYGQTLSCAAAGHPGPLIWLADSATVVDPFSGRGLPLGVRSFSTEPTTTTIPTPPGTCAVFFTDGLVEYRHDYLGSEADLRTALASERIRNSLHPARAIRRFVVHGKHDDDLAVLFIEQRPRA